METALGTKRPCGCHDAAETIGRDVICEFYPAPPVHATYVRGSVDNALACLRQTCAAWFTALDDGEMW